MIDKVKWFRQIWPFPLRRERALRDYQALAEHKYALTDIGLRGGVFSALPRVPGDVFGDGINEGRRQLAIEIITLSGTKPEDLLELIERRPAGAST